MFITSTRIHITKLSGHSLPIKSSIVFSNLVVPTIMTLCVYLLHLYAISNACRCQKRFMCLAGMWFSRDKPTMNTVLKPIIDEINALYTEGISVLLC